MSVKRRLAKGEKLYFKIQEIEMRDEGISRRGHRLD